MSYETQLRTNNQIKLLDPFVGARVHHKMQCLVCDHIWSATPLSKSQTFKKYGRSGCPACADAARDDKHADARRRNLLAIAEKNLIVLSPGYDGRREVDGEKIEVHNTVCGHTFSITPANLLSTDVVCSVCGTADRVAAFIEMSRITSTPKPEWQVYADEVRRLSNIEYSKHLSSINPTNLPRGKSSDPSAYKLEHIAPVRFCFERGVPAEACAHYTNLRLVKWNDKVGSRTQARVLPPLISLHLSMDDKMASAASLLQHIIPNSDKFVMIADVLVTVFAKTANRAIVVVPIDRTQANMKTGAAIQKSLLAAGVNYTILFEDELRDSHLLEAKLKHYTHESDTMRLHARRCEIRTVSSADKRRLLTANHVQGNDAAQICYGAYFNEELVAVMTFAVPRVALGQKNRSNLSGVWELSRFCTDVNYRIPGIASKLLTHFKRNHEWREIYSYADKRWSVGNMYHQLGFNLVADNPPDYFYVVDGTRKHRWSFRKDVLKTLLPKYNPDLTEYQNMEAHGYWRVWGCGTLKFSIIKGEE